MLGDGRMQLAFEVLPGEKLQFTGGQVALVDHGNLATNTAVVLKVLRTPGFTVMPTAREDNGWEDWFPDWVKQCEDKAPFLPCAATVIYPVRGEAAAVEEGPASQNIGLVTSQEEVERRRVEGDWSDVVKPVGWEDAVGPTVTFPVTEKPAMVMDYSTYRLVPVQPPVAAVTVTRIVHSSEHRERPRILAADLAPQKPKNHKADCPCRPCSKIRRLELVHA